MKPSEELIKLLFGYNETQVENYARYCIDLEIEKNLKGDNKGQLKNKWMKFKTNDILAEYFKSVASDGLVFDGVHITLQSTGISYDYQAYKNKMLIAYPETIIDVALVYSSDTFRFEKNSGKVTYTHDIIDPFSRTDEKIIGGYCVIKNKRGDFLTTLTKADLDKHQKVAKTQYIWNNWYSEMCLKTVIKKACKQHFNDIYQNINDNDNQNNDIDNDLSIALSVREEIENITTVESLSKYWKDNGERHKSNAKGFNRLVTNHKNKLIRESELNNENN
jgi:hypothetical protein